MPRLYIHIPYCHRACHYCNFHFSTSLKTRDEMLDALCREIEMRQNYLGGHTLKSLYFGGGTPSLLSPEELDRLIQAVMRYFKISPEAEVTLEANPEDIREPLLSYLKGSPINRISLGIQSFYDIDLKLLNRSHSARQAFTAIDKLQDAGINQLSVDLIFGIPGLTPERWKKNLETVVKREIPHVSAYNLTIEPRTALKSMIERSKIPPPDEEITARQFELTMDFMETHGYHHYEISNYCKPGFQANHNTAYWRGEPYLGIGPGAHSYNGVTRQWNVSNNMRYIKSIQSGVVPATVENLTLSDRVNEYVLTSLRTSSGCDAEFIKKQFGHHFAEEILQQATSFIEEGFIAQQSGILRLTRKGKLFADHVISGLFVIEHYR